jgi:hypothetical protein
MLQFTPMKLKFGRAAATAMLIACGGFSASASVISLTFEGLQNIESINNYYNGGFGGSGSGPGPNHGITFSSDSLAVISVDNGGTGNFTGALAPSPHTIAFFLMGAGDTMNVASGFTTGFSFFYTSPFFSGTVNVFDGLDGSGTLLASLTLAMTTDTTGTTGHPYDDWHTAGVTFSGTANSVVFTGVANQIGFDNITLGSSNPVVPDGGSALILALMGITGLGAFRFHLLRRERRSAE